MPTHPASHRHLLVTTTRAAWLVDLAARRARLVDEGRGVYYGISFSRDRVFIACRQAEVGADREGQDNAILCFDRRLRPVEVLRPAPRLRDVHQIVCRGDTLLACSTYDDAVLRFSLHGRTWDAWYPFGRSDRGRDRHHINSVGLDGDAILLAGNKPSGWFARLAEGATMPDAPTPLGIGTHNVWVEGGAVAVCSSDEGAIRLSTGARRDLADRGWLRGFARDEQYAYVGVSQNRVRGVRDRSDCMILQVDAAGAVVDTYAFMGFGMLHDMRVLGVADLAHNGIAFELSTATLLHRDADYMLPADRIDLQPR